MGDIVKTEDKRREIMPACVISENEGSVELKIEMPGVPKDGVEVRIERNELSVIGRKDNENREGGYLIRERLSGDFRKTFTLDDTIDKGKIKADYANGVMRLTLSLKEADKPRRIEISAP